MPRKKIYENQIKQIDAWKAENTEKIQFSVRKDSALNKAFIQRLVVASGLKSVTELILTALGEYAINHLGLDWYNENKNKPSGEGEK